MATNSAEYKKANTAFPKLITILELNACATHNHKTAWAVKLLKLSSGKEELALEKQLKTTDIKAKPLLGDTSAFEQAMGWVQRGEKTPAMPQQQLSIIFFNKYITN